MFGFSKNKDDGLLSPPIRGSWEFNFNRELQQAVKRREKLNKQLEEDGSSRKSSTNSNTSIESNQSINSLHSLGSPPTSQLASPSPSPIIPVTPQFTYSPSKTMPSLSPPKALTTSKPQTNLSAGGIKSKTLPSELNLRVETETGGHRESLALDRRNTSVFNMISMFNNVIDDDAAKLLRKRSTTVSTGQTDINSSKFY